MKFVYSTIENVQNVIRVFNPIIRYFASVIAGQTKYCSAFELCACTVPAEISIFKLFRRPAVASFALNK